MCLLPARTAHIAGDRRTRARRQAGPALRRTAGPPGSLWQSERLHLLVAVAGLEPRDDHQWDFKPVPFRMEPRAKKAAAPPVQLKRPPPSLV